MGDAQRWYAGGLRFECTQCGNCCTGPPGYVWFTDEEGAAMAGAHGMSLQAFRRRYAHKVDGCWSLKDFETPHGYDCVFLDRETIPGKAICGIYEHRPTQCRTWPFWPENLASKRAWEVARRTTPCPGMNQGKLVPVENIRIQRAAHEAD